MRESDHPTDNHVTVLIRRALQLAREEEFVEALDFLQKATDQITQVTARKLQVAMVGGGRPYRRAG
jgi:uridylate kinase